LSKEVYQVKEWEFKGEIEKLIDELIDKVDSLSFEEKLSLIKTIIQVCMGVDDLLKRIEIKGESVDGDKYHYIIK
jgi:hypothetical protein